MSEEIEFDIIVNKKKLLVWKDDENDLWYVEGCTGDGFTTLDELYEELEEIV